MDLRYYPDTNPGFTRQRRGRGFSFLAPDGTRVERESVIARLKALAVPPAYEDVWMSLYEEGHLQATGRDEAGRKQYRYHELWAEWRARRKFDDLAEFGSALPRIRRWIGARLTGAPGERETAVAAVMALMDRASIRVGSPEYAETNGSFGATTLQAGHVEIDGAAIRLAFPAKGGDEVDMTLQSARLAEVLEASQDLSGAALVTYGDDGHSVRSEHLSEVLAELAGPCASPKTFRTWNGTHAAYLAAANGAATIKAVSEAAAERLHNTPAIARESYVHPDVIEAVREGRSLAVEDEAPAGYRRGEAALLDFLRR